MSSLDSKKAFLCESVHWTGTSLLVNSLKALTTSNLDETLQGNSAFGILRITSTMVGTGLTPSGLSWNPVKITYGVLNLYLAGYSLSNTCYIRSRKLSRFSSWSFSASSCAIPHPCLRTRSAMFSYRYFSFLPGLPDASLDISRFRWRLARADVATSTCQKEYERLWLSLISDLKYFGETRYRISYLKIICIIQLWQNVLKTGNLPFRLSISRVTSRDFCCKQTAKVRTLGQLPTTRVRNSAFCCR